MYRSILVPIDGSTFGEHALPLALSIARRSGAAVRLAHVHVANQLVYAIGMPVGDDALDTPSRESECAYLDGLAQHLSATWGVEVTTDLLDGMPADTLRRCAIETAADLVVMSTHGRGPVSRFWLGSVADTLVRQLPIPVLLARPHQESLDLLDLQGEPILQRVLIPLDGSPLAEDALEYAVGLGETMGAQYTLLQAIDPIVMDYAPVARSAGLDEQLVEEWRAEAQTYLDQVAARLRERSLQVQTSIAVAAPALAILDYARHHGTELIAMATHGRSGVSRLLLGSVADKVVRGACAPVLLHRASA